MVRFTENGGEPFDEALAPVIPLFGGPVAEPVIERAERDETRRRPPASDPVVERAERDETRPPTFSEEYWLDEDHSADEPPTPSTDDVDEPMDRDKLRENAATSLTRSLGRRGLSVSEARVRLRSDGLTAEESQAVVDAFIERGWLDDAVLAEQLVHSATTRKGMGTQAIRQLLVKRSVARDVIDDVIADLPDDDAERALEFARGKARSLVRLDDETATRRLMGMLARRGFGGSVAGKAARTALADERRNAGGSAVRFR
jgi:regulatory protein